ncbi:MAG: helix-turn-helix domain-containing protein [bacterium]
MIHVVFRLRRDRPMTRIAAAHPDARLVLWCNLQNDVVEIQARDAAQTTAIAGRFARELDGVRRLGDERAPPRTLVFNCPHGTAPSVSRLVEDHGCLLIPPIVLQAGWDTFRVFCFDEALLPGFFRKLRAMGEFEILSKRKLEAPVVEEQFMFTAADILGSLTGKQSEALLAAMAAGYYDVPRTATMQDIARRLGRPRTTMEEHVRKAEGKVLLALAPLVALRLGPDAQRPVPLPGKRRRR